MLSARLEVTRAWLRRVFWLFVDRRLPRRKVVKDSVCMVAVDFDYLYKRPEAVRKIVECMQERMEEATLSFISRKRPGVVTLQFYVDAVSHPSELIRYASSPQQR